jgi:hypothetical protein
MSTELDVRDLPPSERHGMDEFVATLPKRDAAEVEG